MFFFFLVSTLTFGILRYDIYHPLPQTKNYNLPQQLLLPLIQGKARRNVRDTLTHVVLHIVQYLYM